MNPEPPADALDLRRLISALADGEGGASELERTCAAWADPVARRSWHAYHLIGDVLRSDELASPPGRDQAFLTRLQQRLAEEPVVRAAQPLPARTRPFGRPAWVVPAALAAGVMALASALILTLGQVGGSPPATMAVAPGKEVLADAANASPPVLEAPVQPGGRVVRDAQLDRYLRAHRDYGTALPGSLPGGPGRSITTVSLDR